MLRDIFWAVVFMVVGVAIGVFLYRNCEGFRNFVDKHAEKIEKPAGEAIAKGCQAIKNAANKKGEEKTA